MQSYFAYIRVSTTKQGEGASLQEQRLAIEAFARRHDLHIAAWYEELETAAKQGRSGFNKMLAAVERGRAAGVIIHKIDRSARNLKDWARLGDLIDRGVEVHFAHESLDLSTRGGRLAADLQAVVAADFIRNLRDEVRKGIYGRLRQGFFPRAAPVGYLNNGKARPKTIDPVKGPLVRAAFELYATGRYSLHSLRAELATRGLTTAKGEALPVGNFARMLHNPFYIGIMRVPASSEEFPGNHDPIVSQTVFNRVQDVLSGRLYPRTQIHTFRYRRLLTCAACGRSLTGERQKGRVYYRCHAGECRGTSVAERQVDNCFENTLAALSLESGNEGQRDMGDVVDIRSAFRERVDQEVAGGDAHRATIDRDLALVEARLERLTDAFLDGSLDRETFTRRKALLLRNQLELRERQDEPHSTKWQKLAEWFELGLTAKQAYGLANEAARRDLVSTLGSNFVVQRNDVDFTLFQPFAAMREYADLKQCEPDQTAVRTLFMKTLEHLPEPEATSETKADTTIIRGAGGFRRRSPIAAEESGKCEPILRTR